MDISAYLKRIDYAKPVKPDVQTLSGLQFTHMDHVPFENLDIQLKRPIHLDEGSLWNKIVINRRGGFCYELNGLFAWLLEQIGFEVAYLNARVYNR
jgi:N-hydroxyarylamine O-acetyltransferase